MSASPEQQWSPEEDNIIRSLVKQGRQLKEMPPYLLKRTLRGIQCRVYTLGLKSGQPRTKHSKDELFWETPNPLNSYYAGLLAADGSIATARAALQWVCEKTDKAAMEKLVIATRFTGQIEESLKKSPCSENISTHCRLSFSACQKWNADLARNFNVIPQKAHRLAPPAFSSDFLACCYLIGYTDGDGCINVGKPKGVLEMPALCYVSASLSIIEWIQSFVEAHFPFSRSGRRSNIRSSSERTYHHYRINGMNAIKLFDFLRRIDVPKFDRKWSNPAFLALVDTYKQRWPEYFAPDKELAFNEAGNIVFASTLPQPQPKNPSPSPILLQPAPFLV